MTPVDLVGLDGGAATQRLFGERPPCAAWWQIERADPKHLIWRDERLGFQRRMTHGELVSLSEISTAEQAVAHAAQNKITLLPDGGIHFKAHRVVELFLRCHGLYPPDELDRTRSLYQIALPATCTASVGYASLWFQHLVLRPAGESNPNLPDPTTIHTLAIHDTDLDEISGRAELALYHLRRSFPKVRFAFWPLPKLAQAPGLEPQYSSPQIGDQNGW